MISIFIWEEKTRQKIKTFEPNCRGFHSHPIITTYINIFVKFFNLIAILSKFYF